MEEINLRAVVHYEDGFWVAHLLEMDLVGTGTDPDGAVEDLRESFMAQVSFCAQNGINPFRLAPQDVLNRWNEFAEATLLHSITPPAARPRMESDLGRGLTRFLSYTESEVDRFRNCCDFQPA